MSVADYAKAIIAAEENAPQFPVGPQGMQGEPGFDGQPGPQGERGPVGPQGDTGYGVPGVDGTPGKEGPSGPQGDRGPKGDKGEKGDRGERGYRGEQGEQGATGAGGASWMRLGGGGAGTAGPAGPQGAQGAAGATGATGSAGAAGSTGPKGDKGDTGDAGATGSTGATGATGPAGADGLLTAPTLAEVLAAGNSAEDSGITNAGEVTARDGGVATPGNSLFLRGGNGDDGNDQAAQIQLAGGVGDGTPGNLQIRTAGVTGNPGDRLTVAADGSAIWSPFPVTVSDADPGATGKGSIWLRSAAIPGDAATTYAVYVRNDTDTGWLVTASAFFDAANNLRSTTIQDPDAGDAYEVRTYDALGTMRNDVSIYDTAMEYIHSRADGTKASEVAIGDFGGDEAAITVESYDTDGTTILATLTVSPAGIQVGGVGQSVLMPGLPTSDPAVAGALWNNLGVLMVSAG